MSTTTTTTTTRDIGDRYGPMEWAQSTPKQKCFGSHLGLTHEGHPHKGEGVLSQMWPDAEQVGGGV